MGAIAYDFPGVPEQPSDGEVSAARALVRAGRQFDSDGEPVQVFADAVATLARRRAFTGIYEDLERGGFPVPSVGSGACTRDQLVRHLQKVAGDLLKKELTQDPLLLYDPDESDGVTARTINPTHDNGHLARILGRLPHAPNVITDADVAGALKG